MLDVRLPGAHESAGGGFAHTFAAGAITVVLGPNLSGKTDLCRLIAGLSTRATGQVCWHGEPLSERARQRQAAFVYQAFVNYPNLTVYDNIASPLRAQRMDREVADRKVTDLARGLGLEPLLKRLPHELSGGQQQRVAIARALAKEAPVLLLDEPLVNLDFKLREALEGELRDLLVASRTTVVYTSSDPREVFNVADEVLLLKEGRLLQSGVPMLVYDQPASLDAMALLSDPQVNRFERDGVAHGVRPEHLDVMPDEDDREGYVFAMRVTAAETNGVQTYVHGDVEAASWVVSLPGVRSVAPGSELTLRARPADVVRFAGADRG